MRNILNEKVSQLLMDFDPDIISKIVLHLLQNTIEFTPENRKVEIRISLNENEDFFTLRETDNGKGISQGKVLDIILSNVKMPEMDGIEMVGRLKPSFSTRYIPLMMLTAKTDIDKRLSGLERGADAYRTKDAFVMKVKNILEKNLDNETFNIHNLSSELAISHAQLYRKFKSIYNIGICEYLKIMRLNKARELLTSSNLNVTQVAFAAGFKNLSHFSREFALKFGKTPKKMQKTGCVKLVETKQN